MTDSNKPTPLGKVLQDMLEETPLGDMMQRHRLFEHWESLVGPALCSRVRPKKIQGKTLILAVDHPAWIQELQFLKAKLLAKIQQRFPESQIENLRLVLA